VPSSMNPFRLGVEVSSTIPFRAGYPWSTGLLLTAMSFKFISVGGKYSGLPFCPVSKPTTSTIGHCVEYSSPEDVRNLLPGPTFGEKKGVS